MRAWISGAATGVVTFVRTRFVLVMAGVAVLVLGGAGVAWAAGQGGTAYVTATATTGSVEESLALSGTVASASRRDLAFPVAGTVATVDVEVGDRVEAGESLASLDTADLQDAIDSAEQMVTLAEQQLEDDLDSQTSSSSSSSSSTASTPSVASTPASTSVDLTVEVAAVRAAQQNLLDLLQDAEDAENASSAAAAATSLVSAYCDEFGAESFDDPLVSGTSNEDQLTALQDLLALCQQDLAGISTALTDVASLEAVTAAAQALIADAMGTLDDAVTALADKAGSPGAPSTGGGSTPSTGGSTPTQSSSTPGGVTARTATAADIAADRAAIAAAEAEVAVAQANLAAGVLTTPIAGTVAQVAFAVGDDVTAGSSTQVVTILGDDGYVVEATVGLSDVQKIAVGQIGTAVLPSSGASYDAEVSAVGFVNVSTGSSPEYTVTVTVDAGDVQLLEGAAVQVEIQVAVAEDVLIIPVSALHRSETGDSVDVLVGGDVTTRQVEVGAIGAVYVEIVEGLEVDDLVVLADPSQEIESEGDSGDTGLTGLTGGQDDEFTIPEGFTPPQFTEGGIPNP